MNSPPGPVLSALVLSASPESCGATLNRMRPNASFFSTKNVMVASAAQFMPRFGDASSQREQKRREIPAIGVRQSEIRHLVRRIGGLRVLQVLDHVLPRILN